MRAGELRAALGQPRKRLEAEFEVALELAARGAAEGAEQQILLDRQLGKQPPAFRHQRDAEIDDLLGGAADQIVMHAVDFGDDRAVARPHHAHDAFHQRRLAVAVGAEQHHGLAAADRERNVLDHAHRAVGGVDAADGEATGQDKPSPLPDRASRPSGSPSAILRPETSTTSRCEKLITARMMCSIRMMVTPCSFKPQQQRQNLLDLRMGEAGHRFVGDQQLRLRRHGAREFELAHLDLGQVARQPLRLAVEPDLRSSSMQRAVDLARRAPTVGAAARDRVEQRDAQIVGEPQAGERPRQLKAARQAAAGALMGARAVEQMAVEA